VNYSLTATCDGNGGDCSVSLFHANEPDDPLNSAKFAFICETWWPEQTATFVNGSLDLPKTQQFFGPNELRGTGMAFYSFASGLVGTAAGPVLVAMFSDRLFGGGASIGFGMATLVAICCPAAAICLGLALRPMREAVAAAEQWSR